MAEAFPLNWPAGYPRTTNGRSRSKFGAFTFTQARDALMDELRRLRARDVILSTNLPLRKDGLPYANQTLMKDPGVAVYFTIGYGTKQRKCALACDRWDKIEDNMRSLELTIDAMRGMDRWGCSDMLDRAFTGFAALPPPPTAPVKRPWPEVLGVTANADLDFIETIYRNKMRSAHPDAGGSHEKAQELNAAIQEARQARARA